MPRRAEPLQLLIELEPQSEAPLNRRLYDALRRAILSGRLAPGRRLPSSRTMARELKLARNTVLAALDQLFAEGYVETRPGSGAFVARDLPDPPPRSASGRRRMAPPRAPEPSRRGRRLAAAGTPRATGAGLFAPGALDPADFPFALWARLLARSWRRPAPEQLSPGDGFGHVPLRQAIADYLRAARAVDCAAEQVMIVTGVRQAASLAARLLTDPGARVWFEEPGYLGLRGALASTGLEIVPVPVDDEGLSVEAGRRLAPDARLVCTAPSHQYPLGQTMSLSRRLALLDFARRSDAWILEDDYDSEFRYGGRPLAAMQGLDRDGRVLYVGSFSKTMFASLRLGYLVVPAHLVDLFGRGRLAGDDPPGLLPQPALARFIEEGHLAQHVRRMRHAHAERQAALVEAIRRYASGALEVRPSAGGLHLVAYFTPALSRRLSDTEAEARAQAAGLAAPALSRHYLGPRRQQGLLLGYAAAPAAAIAPAVRRLARALDL